ncbi:uncharacterized protein [Dysidea avara]|uniref:uncharacterized protein isoform X1 n=1 Tax=Dysidea avara TaxID=196820 RepID=UPI00332B0E6F
MTHNAESSGYRTATGSAAFATSPITIPNRDGVVHAEATSGLPILLDIVSSPQSKTEDDNQIADIALVGRQLTNPTRDEENIIFADDSNVVGGHVDVTSDFDDDVHEPLVDDASKHADDDDVPEQKPEDETPVEETNKAASKSAEIVLTTHLPIKAEGNAVAGTHDKSATITKQKQTSERICRAVSEYYEKQFIKEWKESTKHEKRPITVVAALLVERKEKLKVVLLTAGTRIKHECTYFTKTDDDNIEPFWGLCDGHAEAVCYRLASFYLLTEIYKQNDGVDSILDVEIEGYCLKDGIKLHLFTSHPPCGFFATPERHFLSWKQPFIGKPHSLQCSSIILIASYLGIQGPLSHLFVKPVYISSITIPRYESVTALHSTYITERLDKFWIRLTSCSMDNDTIPVLGSQYHFNRLHVEVVDVSVKKLFPKHFVPYIDEKHNIDKKLRQVTYTKQGALRTAGTMPDVIGNANIFALVFTLEDGIGSTIHRESVIELISKLVKLPCEVKQKRLDLLREAQKRLIMAFKVSEALAEQKKLVAQ